MRYDGNRALELLRLGCGQPSAKFRPDQEDAIRHVVEGRGRLLVIQKTGWGKSFVYFIAARLMREAGRGPALLISPLLSLMRNQLDAAARMGVTAVTINSNNTEQWEKVESAIEADEVDILIISPERLANERFISRVLSEVAGRISSLVVDEAHCISDWGHDFRPDYRRLERIIKTLPKNLRVLATTATANDRVMKDLQEVLGPDLEISKGDLARPSLTLQTIRLPDQAQRLAWLAQVLPRLPGSGIIYALTVRDTHQVATWLRKMGLDVRAYSGQSEGRQELEDALTHNAVKALVATPALGMGYDKPDLGFVVHYQAPRSVVAYYQQVGRAGRGSLDAYGVLLSGQEDDRINNHFIDSAFPTKEQVEVILEALEDAPEGLSVPELLTVVNINKGRVEKTTQLLSLESPAPIVKQGTKWQLTAADLSEEFWRRAERLTKIRRSEHGQMQKYIDLDSGHMEYLIQALDGDPSRVRPPTLRPLPTSPDESLVREAVNFLRRMDLPLPPRKRWPDGGMPRLDEKGRIPIERCAETGRALCVWGDAGWARLVRAGMYDNKFLDDKLVKACALLIARWSPSPSPTWVTCLPSTRQPDLVPGFSERLAKELDLPFEMILKRVGDRPQQKTMANSAQQARNVDGAFELISEPRSEPVLLVDDLVNSGWTMTVAAWLLRRGGCEAVFPLALATVGGR